MTIDSNTNVQYCRIFLFKSKIMYTNNIHLYTHFIWHYKINGIIFILPTDFVLPLFRRRRVIK